MPSLAWWVGVIVGLALACIPQCAALCDTGDHATRASCYVSSCSYGSCGGPPPFFNYTRAQATFSAQGNGYRPSDAARAASEMALDLAFVAPTPDPYPWFGKCTRPFTSITLCSSVLQTGVASCAYKLCLWNEASGARCGTYADSFRPSIAANSHEIPVPQPIEQFCDRSFIDPAQSFTIPAPVCWQDQYTCSEFPDKNAFDARSPLRGDIADMEYWLGVAKPLEQYYQCDAGYVLVNQTATTTFQECAADFQRQCVRPVAGTSPSGAALLPDCASHGTCNTDWTLTNILRGGATPTGSNNNIYKSCTCDPGFTSPTKDLRDIGTELYCSVAPCLDQWSVSQYASNCVGHGTCSADSANNGEFSCDCSAGYAGEVCQWPKTTAAVVGPLGDVVRRKNIVFVYHGPTDRGVESLATSANPVDGAAYSMRFSPSLSDTTTLTESVSGVTTTLTIRASCYVAPNTSPDNTFGGDVLLALYAATPNTAHAIAISTTEQNTWVTACLRPVLGIHTGDQHLDPCRLPFMYTGLSGSMQDVCVPPLAADVATVTFAQTGTVYCMKVPATHWLAASVNGATHSNFFCWTPWSYQAASAGPAAAFAAFPNAARSDVFCVFQAPLPLWDAMQLADARLEWFHVHNYMKTAGCM